MDNKYIVLSIVVICLMFMLGYILGYSSGVTMCIDKGVYIYHKLGGNLTIDDEVIKEGLNRVIIKNGDID